TMDHAPKHRVIARFARENMWKQIWSLNWDCVLVSAFESVGILRDNPDRSLHWLTSFGTMVTAGECGRVGETNRLTILKPHGCVYALVEAESFEAKGNDLAAEARSRRFLITQTELTALRPAPGGDATQQFV